MLDYTDISNKVADVKNALNSLYELVYSQYDGIFQSEDAEKYQRMLQSIKSADRCMNEVDELNNGLSDVFEENLERLQGGLNMLNELRTYDSGEYDGEPTPTGRVYILMHSNVTSVPHTFVKQHKTDDLWVDIDKFHENHDSCWAFSRQGAKKIIERYQTKTYKNNYDKNLVTFEMLDEYSY